MIPDSTLMTFSIHQISRFGTRGVCKEKKVDGVGCYLHLYCLSRRQSKGVPPNERNRCRFHFSGIFTALDNLDGQARVGNCWKCQESVPTSAIDGAVHSISSWKLDGRQMYLLAYTGLKQLNEEDYTRLYRPFIQTLCIASSEPANGPIKNPPALSCPFNA